MKTNIFKSSSKRNYSELIEMNKEELKQIQGGLRYIAYRSADGSVHYVLYP